MKNTLAVSALVLGLAVAGNSFAQQAGGFQGPGVKLEQMTVTQALELQDDSQVILVGQIEKSLGNEKYTFKDASGSVTVEIDDDDWKGLSVKPEDTIIIKGEVDKGMFKTEIDVDTVELKK